MNFLPESPRWYALRRRYDDALQALLRIRSPADAHAELAQIRQAAEQSESIPKPTWRLLFATPWMRRVVFIGILIAVVNQITGVNSIMYYGTQIISASGLSLDASLVANIGNGSVSLLAMLGGIWLLGFVGRRRMVLVGLTGTTAVHIAIGTVSTAMPEGPVKAYMVLGLTMAFLAFMQGAVGPATWVLLSEVFPGRVRGLGMGAAVFLMWTTNFLITLAFPWAVSSAGIGISATFFVFAGLGVVALSACLKWLPETKGKTLEQIEWDFARGGVPH
jgi:major inositol transporter-like SP family MFS transporter